MGGRKWHRKIDGESPGRAGGSKCNRVNRPVSLSPSFPLLLPSLVLSFLPPLSPIGQSSLSLFFQIRQLCPLPELLYFLFFAAHWAAVFCPIFIFCFLFFPDPVTARHIGKTSYNLGHPNGTPDNIIKL